MDACMTFFPWSVGNLWSLVTSLCSWHMDRGCLFGGPFALEEEHWAFCG
jgi:hypothetical protein